MKQQVVEPDCPQTMNSSLHMWDPSDELPPVGDPKS